MTESPCDCLLDLNHTDYRQRTLLYAHLYLYSRIAAPAKCTPELLIESVFTLCV